MMILSQKPSDYSPAFGPLRCKLENCDAASSIDVAVTDLRSGLSVGVKRLRGAGQYVFDIAAYVQALLDPAPCDAAQAGFVEKPGHTARVKVTAPGVDSDEMVFTAGCSGTGWADLPDDSDGRQAAGWDGQQAGAQAWPRSLAPGQRDEIGFFAPGERVTAQLVFAGADGEYSFSPGGFDAGKDMVALALPHDGLREALAAGGRDISAFDSFEAVVSAGGEEIIRQKYALAQAATDSVRLAWVDRQGGINRHTFVAVTGGGVGRVDGMAHRQTQVVSGFGTPGEVAALSEILVSPRVWLETAAGCGAIEITDQRVEFAGGESPARLALTFRPARAEIIRRMPW